MKTNYSMTYTPEKSYPVYIWDDDLNDLVLMKPTSPRRCPHVSASKFYTENNLEVLSNVLNYFRGKDTEFLKTALSEINRYPIGKFRITLMAISFELANRGIAPRWQGVLGCAANEQQYKIITPSRRSDSIIIDLYWLSKEFPRHRPINARWSELFALGFDMKLAVSIADRQMNRCRKVVEIATTPYQELGCIALYTNASKTLRKQAIKKASDRRLRAVTHCNKKSAEDVNQDKKKIIFCAKLANCSPSKTADVFRWMTGETRSRQSMQNLITRYKIKKIKK